MATRESWEEVSFQVFTDEDGVLRSGYYPTGEGLVTGNVKVAREWGNLPMQPNDDRTDQGTSIGGGYGDVGWSSTYVATSDVLRTADYQVELNNLDYKVPADSHTIATTGYSNFPEFIPNYAGDGDADLERIVPSVRGLLRNAAQDKINDAGLSYNRTYVNYDVNSFYSQDKFVTVQFTDDHAFRVGDVISVYYNDGDGFSGNWVDVTITEVTDPDAVRFEVPTAYDPELDVQEGASGYAWTDNRFVILQNPAAGSIVNDGSDVSILVLNYD